MTSVLTKVKDVYASIQANGGESILLSVHLFTSVTSPSIDRSANEGLVSDWRREAHQRHLRDVSTYCVARSQVHALPTTL